MEIAKFVIDHPDAPIVPPTSPDPDLKSIRRRFADAVRKEMERRKRSLKILTYDDVLIRLSETLRDEQRGPAACARLRERYDVVLVDEFQDTDPVQWDIMRRALRRRRSDARPHRRSEAGDLCLSWSGCPCLSDGTRGGAFGVDARRQLAQ